MCIRDRLGQLAQVSRQTRLFSLVRVDVAQQLHQKSPANHTCLLYTSDAADERSSVDLGGRRLIKKKKHDKH